MADPQAGTFHIAQELCELASRVPWEFEKRGREINVRVEGQVAVTSLELARSAALDGLGLAYLPEDLVKEPIAKKQLVRVLEDWCEPFPG